jgi:6,7-dimethyl-8-ribityllumazine synthase
MDRTLEGVTSGDGLRVALVVSRFNEFVTGRLLAAAEACLEQHGCPAGRRTVVHVPGAWEIPQAARWLAERGEHDAIVALGALVRGETPHFDVLAQAVAVSLSGVAADSRLPLIFGVLTTDTVEQALARAGDKAANKGWESALAALRMANLRRLIADGRG